VLRLDERRRRLLPMIEERRARQNKASEEIATAKREGRDAAEQIAAMRELSGEIKKLQSELGEVEPKRDELLAGLPNLPEPGAPDGDSENDAKVLREVGERRDFGFEPLDHLELGQRHGWIEMEAAAQLSGSRFA
jgi:seryl-tRNA synthetase